MTGLRKGALVAKFASNRAGRRRGGEAAALAIGLLLVAAVAGRARAQDADSVDPTKAPVEVHGFVSQGFIKSTGNNYLAESKRGSFEFAEAGINVTKVLQHNLRVGVQLFTRDLGPIGNYNARFDWFYLDYRLADWLGLRAGRTKLPYGLYNELSDVDAARVPILLPQATYPIRGRDYLLAQTGLELYGTVPLAAAGWFEYRIYGGTIFVEAPLPNPSSPFRVENQSIPYVAGGRGMWETPLSGLRVGGSLQFLRVDYEFTGNAMPIMSPGAPNGVASAKIPVRLWVASAEYAGTDLLLAAEYGRWKVDLQSSAPEVVPSRKTTSERFYGLAAYRVNSWLTPGVYHARMFVDVNQRQGRQNHQHDTALTLRFDLTPNWLLKLEAHHLDGNADVTSAQNGRRPLRDLENSWFLFLAKTTVYF